MILFELVARTALQACRLQGLAAQGGAHGESVSAWTHSPAALAAALQESGGGLHDPALHRNVPPASSGSIGRVGSVQKREAVRQLHHPRQK